MDKSHLKIIKGGPEYAINQASKKFISGFVTNTRLMGVVVVYIHWQLMGENTPSSLHQFFYVETTESGIETYRSVYGNNQKALIEIELSMMGGLGGEKVGLTEKESYILVQKYAKMTEDFGERLPGGVDEFGFLLDEEIEYTDKEEKALFKKTCVDITTAEQLINYFLIRYVTSDFVAADFLCTKPMEHDIAPNSKNKILCLNKIEIRTNENEDISYMCESLVEDNMHYNILITEIHLTGKLISSFEKISQFTVSTAEAAMKLARPEFVTVFEIMEDSADIESTLEEMYPAALKKGTELGKAFLLFKNNNDHLKESFYRLNDDIKGIIYVTNEGQLVLAGYSLTQIHKFESEMQFSQFGSFIIALAKYEFKESILYDFMQSDTGDFLHFMEYVSDYDPDDE